MPQDLAAACPRAVQPLVRKASRNHIAPERIRSLIESARITIALQEGTAARREEIRRLLARWEIVRRQLSDVEGELGELVDVTRAAKALLTVPGVNVVCAATLVADLGEPNW